METTQSELNFDRGDDLPEEVLVNSKLLLDVFTHLQQAALQINRLCMAFAVADDPAPDQTTPPATESEAPAKKKYYRRPLEEREPWRFVTEAPPLSESCIAFLAAAEFLRDHGLTIGHVTKMLAARWPESGHGVRLSQSTVGNVIRERHNLKWMLRPRTKNSTFPEGQMFWGSMMGEKKLSAAASIVGNLSISDMTAAKEG